MMSLIRRRAAHLWEDQTETMIQRVLAAAEAAQSARDRRNWRRLHDFLRNVHFEHTHEAAQIIYPDRSQEWGQADGALYRFFPIIKSYCDRLAVAMATRIPEFALYDGDTGEDLPRNHPESIQWDQDLADSRATIVLPQLERFTIAMENAIIGPEWTGDRIRWCVTPVYQARVWQSVRDPSEWSVAQAIAFELAQPVDSVGQTQPSIWSTWTRRETDQGVEWGHYVHRSTGAPEPNPLFADNVNHYGMFPHVLVRLQDPAPGELWIPPNEAWIRQQIGLNLALTDMWHGARYQIHPMAVFNGAEGRWDRSEIPATGPGKSIPLPRDVTLDFVSPDLNLDEYRALIDHDLMTTGVSESIDPTTYTAEGAYNSIAGLQLRRHDLQLRRERVIPYFKAALEDELWPRHRAVGNYWADSAGRTRYAPTTKLRATFRPLPNIVDRQADAQATEIEIRRGITSEIERIMDREGVSRREAERLHAERKRAAGDQAAPVRAVDDQQSGTDAD